MSTALWTGVTVGALVEHLQQRLPGEVRVRCMEPSWMVTGVSSNAASVGPGELFVARPGRRVHGARFIGDALQRGCVAVLTDLDAALPGELPNVIRVGHVPSALAAASQFVFGEPSQCLRLVGVTGTNGKTSVVWALQHALGRLGVRAARLGTLGFDCAGESVSLGLTTAESDTTARCLRRALALGASVAAMEVTSVALESDRASGLRFEVAAFTNLTRDHLDYHGTFEAYQAAKAKLFHRVPLPPVWVVNVDDPMGRNLARGAPPAARVLAVGRTSEATVRFTAAVGEAGVEATVHYGGAHARLRSRWLGEHNLENLMVAVGILLGLDVDLGDAVAALEPCPPPPGRLERCDRPGDGPAVVVDYAHTPDALERVLLALRPHTRGALWCVFGCGGDRDPGKRELMGRVAGTLAEHCVVTSDNPRSESPATIAAQVVAGLQGTSATVAVELDRARAIALAVRSAKPGDCVLIAGKGHETVQELASGMVPFDDRVQARVALEERGAL